MPISPCMTLLPWTFSPIIYKFDCVIYFDISVVPMILLFFSTWIAEINK